MQGWQDILCHKTVVYQQVCCDLCSLHSALPRTDVIRHRNLTRTLLPRPALIGQRGATLQPIRTMKRTGPDYFTHQLHLMSLAHCFSNTALFLDRNSLSGQVNRLSRVNIAGVLAGGPCHSLSCYNKILL